MTLTPSIAPPFTLESALKNVQMAEDARNSSENTLWVFRENRIAVSFEYEWHDDKGQWYCSYGIELWEFDEKGLMRQRLASINDAPIAFSERRVL